MKIGFLFYVRVSSSDIFTDDKHWVGSFNEILPQLENANINSCKNNRIKCIEDVPNKTRPACIKTQYLLIVIHKYGIYSVVNKRMQTVFKMNI